MKPRYKIFLTSVLFALFAFAILIFVNREKEVVIDGGVTVERGGEAVMEPTNYDVKEPEGKEFVNLGNFWIEIDTEDLKVKAPIVDGVLAQDLKKGVGHHVTTPYPSEESGNVVLSGHRWVFGQNPANKVFENLDKLKIGDHVRLFYNGKEYIYEVEGNQTVGSKAVEILEQGDTARLTLYTCTPKFTALKRLVYTAKLVDIK